MKKETSLTKIQELYKQQKKYYLSQATKPIDFRIQQLQKLKSAIKKHEKEILDALWIDLHKCKEEAYLTEIGITLKEIDFHIKNITQWAKPQKVSSSVITMPSSGKIVKEPLGNTLIVSPWNYPVNLFLNPLIGSISAGNCATVKPSPDTPNVAKVLQKLIDETFEIRYIACIQGGRETNEHLFEVPFDMVFFTGSSKVGSIFMQKFGKHLSKMVLELGGKSPCIVHQGADLSVAAKRIVWGKTINSGQTCIAPDYLFVHKDVKDDLVKAMKKVVVDFFGDDMQKSENFARMVNADAFNRVSGYLKDGKVVLGGKIDEQDKFIEFTVLDEVSKEADVMQNEIFGPVLPMLTFESVKEAVEYLDEQPKPLALYYFGKSKSAEKIINRTTSGGACINDTLMHIANHEMPFGGVGNSGMGNYHGKYSFDAFSHERSVLETPTMVDVPVKYAPYPYFGWLKKLM